MLPGCGSFAVQSDVAFAVFEVHARLARDASSSSPGTPRELEGIVPWSPTAAEASSAAAALEARVRELARDHAATPKFDFDSGVRPLVVAYNRDVASGRTGVVSLRARDVRVVDAESGELVASGVAGDGGDDGEGAADGADGRGEANGGNATTNGGARSAPWVDFGLRSASALVDVGEGELEIVELAWDDVLDVGSAASSSSSKIKASRTGGGGLQLLAPLAPPAPGAVPSELTKKRPLERLAVQVTLDARAADELMREKSEVQEWVARQAAAAAAAAGGGGAKKATGAVAGKLSMCVFSAFLVLFSSSFLPLSLPTHSLFPLSSKKTPSL